MFDLRGFLLGCGVVVASLALYGGAQLWPIVADSAAMYRVRMCLTEPGATTCARPSVRRILQEKTGEELMTKFSRTLSPLSCHYIGHVVGQEMFRISADIESAVAACGRECDSACVHGAIGAAYAEALGLDGFGEYDIDLAHLDVSQLRTTGMKLCSTAGTCHGVGHSLFQIYQDFEPAFELCRDVAGPWLNMCYNGVTMEYADALTARSMGILPHIETFDISTLDTLCDFPTLAEVRACFRYFPRIAVTVLEKSGFDEAHSLDRVADICDTQQSDSKRIVCYGGLGSYHSYSIRGDIPGAVQTCEGLGDRQAAAGCMIGMLAVATEDRMRSLAAFCASTSAQYQDVCYHALFFFLERVNVPEDRQRSLCMDTADACLSGFEKRTSDPAVEVRSFR
jgi:hypothetical protein